MSGFNNTGGRRERVARIVKAAANQTAKASNQFLRGTGEAADGRPRSSPTTANKNADDKGRQAIIYHLRDQADEDLKRPASIRPLGYPSWAAMKQRCNNPNHKHYADYGGRGISYCGEWEEFRNFISDMGSPPAPNFTLERLEVEGDYCPENCVWASPRDQARNRRSNRHIWYNGERYTLAALAEQHGISSSTLSARLRTKSIDSALHSPLQRGGDRRAASKAPWAEFDRWPTNFTADTKAKLEEGYGRWHKHGCTRPEHFLDIISEGREKAADVLLANPDEVDEDEFTKSQKLMNACDEATELFRRIRFLMAEEAARMKIKDELW